MTDREHIERWQLVLRVALERMDALRLIDELDESFYEALREFLIAAGATQGEIDTLVHVLITFIVGTRQELIPMMQGKACEAEAKAGLDCDQVAPVRFRPLCADLRHARQPNRPNG